MKLLKKNITFLSPNYNDRDKNLPLDLIVVHYTAMENAKDALKWLCNPESQVSVHYLIDEKGEIFSLVSEEKRAWHAGVSFWEGAPDVNSRSIGIELANDGKSAFPRKQMNSFLKLLEDITHRNFISKERVVGHSDVAPLRKIDPGYFFNWKYLAKKGFGFWPKESHPATDKSSVRNSKKDLLWEVQKQLYSFGYGCPFTGVWDKETQAHVGAFFLHFYKEEYLVFKENPEEYYPVGLKNFLKKKRNRVFLRELFNERQWVTSKI